MSADLCVGTWHLSRRLGLGRAPTVTAAVSCLSQRTCPRGNFNFRLMLQSAPYTELKKRHHMQNYKNTGSERVNTNSQSLGGYPGVNVSVCSNLIPPWAGIRKRGLWEVARAGRLDTSLRAPVPYTRPQRSCCVVMDLLASRAAYLFIRVTVSGAISTEGRLLG